MMPSRHHARSALITLGLTLALATPLHAQDAPPPSPTPFPTSGPAAGGGGPRMPAAKPMRVTVNVRDANAKPAPDVKVTLDTKAGSMVIKTYKATTNAEGVATFEDIRGISSASYVIQASHKGLSIPAPAPVRVTPEDIASDTIAKTATITLPEITHSAEKVRVSDLMATVQLAEKYLIIQQRWTLSHDAPTLFVPSATHDPNMAKGLPLVLPKLAEGIQVMGNDPNGAPLETETVDNIVYLKTPLQPAAAGRPGIQIQLNFSMKLESSDFAYAQTFDYATENVRFIVPLQTRWSKFPILDLTMDSATLKVDQQRGGAELRDDMDFLIGRVKRIEPGGEAAFVLDGFPTRSAPGRWIVLGAALCAMLIGGFLFTRERKHMAASREHGSDLRINVLTRTREDLFEALADLEDRYDSRELSDRAYDIESARLRERLALVLNRLEREQASRDNRAA